MRLETSVSYVPQMRLMYPTHGILLDVDENDPVTAVQEGYGAGPGGIGKHRYQVLLMPRGNVLSPFWTDLGPMADFVMHVDGQSYQAPAYHQLVLSEHTVAECRYMAEHGRMDDFAAQLLHTQVNESDLFEKYRRIIEEDIYIVRNRSTFGPGGTKQRNAYSPYGARRQQEVLSRGH